MIGLDAAVARYTPQGKMAEGFARGKMSGDPVYAAVLEHIRPGSTVLDVGCGEGYLLALAGGIEGVALHGFDHDERRLASAKLAVPEASLFAGDAREVELPRAQVVTVLDVLHYQSAAEQDALIERLASCLAEDGVLLVRDGRSDGGWRTTITTLAERAAVAFGRHKGDGVFFRPQAELQGALEAAGLTVSVDPCHGQTPFANVLFVARR